MALYLITSSNTKTLSRSLRGFCIENNISYRALRGHGNKPIKYPIIYKDWVIEVLPNEIDKLVPYRIGTNDLQTYLTIVLSKLEKL
ncbi:MAG: hypothetical protein CMC55_05960 [Flavobacteriaceae bacterium]|nr:hypothetical protein [Flavobacteriaceae bacterium]